MAGLFLLSGLFGIVALLVPLALVLGLVVVFALRGEQDEGSGRAATLYLALACFVGFLTLLIAVTGLSAGVVELVANDDSSAVDFDDSFDEDFGEDFEFDVDVEGSFDSGSGDLLTSFDGSQDADDRAWTTIIQALIAAVVSLAVLRFHWPRLDAVRTRAASDSAASRMRQSYCYVVCFVVVVTLLVSVTVGAFNVVQMMAPGTTGAGNRGDALESFVPIAVLAIGAAALFRLHWSRVEVPPFLRPEVEPPT